MGTSKIFHAGNKIRIGPYFATCKTAGNRGAVFLFDSYADPVFQMNPSATSRGGYLASSLRQEMNDAFRNAPYFGEIEHLLSPFANGDLVRIPTVYEIFGIDYPEIEPIRCEDVPGRDWRLYRFFEGIVPYALHPENGEEYNGYWLQNRTRNQKEFAVVTSDGELSTANASKFFGVRPVIKLKNSVDMG